MLLYMNVRYVGRNVTNECNVGVKGAKRWFGGSLPRNLCFVFPEIASGALLVPWG